MKRIVIIVLILSLVLTTGCWDMKEINDRIFPYAVGLDLLDKENLNSGRYDIIFTFPNVNAIGEKSMQDQLVSTIDVKGNNIFEATSNIHDRTQKEVYLKELKVNVFSETIAKDPKLMREIIDGLNRDYIVNQGVEFVMVRGSTKDFLEQMSKLQKQVEVEGLLYTLLRNGKGATRFMNIDLNDFIDGMEECSATSMPVARIEDQDMVIDENAVFKNYKLIGYVNKKDNRNISMLTGRVKNFSINAEHKGNDISLQVSESRVKKRFTVEEEGLKIVYKMKLKGQVQQYSMGKGKELGSQEKIKNIESTLEKKLEKSMKRTIKKMQKDLNADLIGLGKHISQFHPKLWKTIENDYQAIFPHIEIVPDIEVQIRRRGLTK